MKKSLIALAALAAVGVASAQSSVTISGWATASYDMFSIGSANAARAGYNTSENRVSDNSSRIIFGMVEDLGGGMRALAQFDLRPVLDQSSRLNATCATPATPAVAAQTAGAATVAQTAAAAQAAAVCSPTPNPLAGGNSHVGLSSAKLGTIRLGRQDLHYTENGNFAPAGSATIQSHAGLLVTAAAGAAVGRTSRTANLVWYTSPVINGFTGTLGLSTGGYSASGNPDAENDLASGQRKGGTKYARLGYSQGPLTAAVSWIDEKSDYIGTASTSGVAGSATAALLAANAANPDRSGTMVTAKYDLGTARLGFALAKNESTAYSAGAAGVNSKRTVWQAGVGIPMGPNGFALTYTKVGSVKANGVESVATGASAVALAYSYDFSKRTQLVVGHNRINNQTNGTHGMFYNADNAIGSIGSGALAGERHSATSIGLRHSF